MDLGAAKQQAFQTNRLVLVHFWATWCLPCKEMEQEVLNKPEVMAALAADYVPVKLNVDQFPHTCRHYDISVLPTDIIITPQGELIERMDGATELPKYVTRLNQVAAARNRSGVGAGQPGAPGMAPTMPAQLAARQPGTPAYPWEQRAESAPALSDDRYADYFSRGQGNAPAGPGYGGPVTAPHGAPLAANRGVPAPQIQGAQAPPPPSAQAYPPQAVSGGPVAIQIPPGNPPLGLDGYCPVRLAQEGRWVLGDVRWGLIHRGRTYLFSGPEQRDRFDVAPDEYAPVLSGNDAVLAVERGEMVPGRREHGAWFEKQVYLFSSEATFQKFNADPHRYVSALRQESEASAARYPTGPLQRGAGLPGPSFGSNRY